jgi:hypothetical protein
MRDRLAKAVSGRDRLAKTINKTRQCGIPLKAILCEVKRIEDERRAERLREEAMFDALFSLDDAGDRD